MTGLQNAQAYDRRASRETRCVWREILYTESDGARRNESARKDIVADGWASVQTASHEG
jgi:hypothetical protein